MYDDLFRWEEHHQKVLVVTGKTLTPCLGKVSGMSLNPMVTENTQQ